MFFRPFIIYFFTFFLFSTFTFAQNDKKVIINGNEDIDDEVIFPLLVTAISSPVFIYLNIA